MWNEPSEEKLGQIPGLYQTEHIPLKDKIIHLHFFIGGCDWYIAEYDGKDTFWGFVILNGDHLNAEWGYIAFGELESLNIKNIEMDNDLYWQPCPANMVTKIVKCPNAF